MLGRAWPCSEEVNLQSHLLGWPKRQKAFHEPMPAELDKVPLEIRQSRLILAFTLKYKLESKSLKKKWRKSDFHILKMQILDLHSHKTFKALMLPSVAHTCPPAQGVSQLPEDFRNKIKCNIWVLSLLSKKSHRITGRLVCTVSHFTSKFSLLYTVLIEIDQIGQLIDTFHLIG